MHPSNTNLPADDLMAKIRAEVQRRKAQRTVTEQKPEPRDSFTAPIPWDKPVSFKAGGNGVACLREGWAQSEADFTWSCAAFASVDITLLNTPSDLLLTMDGAAFTSAHRHRQSILLGVDGILIAQWSVAERAKYSTLLFRRHLRPGQPLTLEFQFPDAHSPASAGMGTDSRHLGLALSSLTLAPLHGV